jgi:hypothetical protein
MAILLQYPHHASNSLRNTLPDKSHQTGWEEKNKVNNKFSIKQSNKRAFQAKLS